MIGQALLVTGASPPAMTSPGPPWSVTPYPCGSPTQDTHLTGVSCISPTACVVVGDVNNDTDVKTLVLSAISVGDFRLVASDGGTLVFGDTDREGLDGRHSINKPVEGMAG